MSRTTRFKIGLIAVLWAIIAGAAAAGWMIGHGNAEIQIAALKQRLAATVAPKPSCGIDIQLLQAPPAAPARIANPFGLALGGILPRAPHHLHLREMLTAR